MRCSHAYLYAPFSNNGCSLRLWACQWSVISDMAVSSWQVTCHFAWRHFIVGWIWTYDLTFWWGARTGVIRHDANCIGTPSHHTRNQSELFRFRRGWKERQKNSNDGRKEKWSVKRTHQASLAPGGFSRQGKGSRIFSLSISCFLRVLPACISCFIGAVVLYIYSIYRESCHLMFSDWPARLLLAFWFVRNSNMYCSIAWLQIAMQMPTLPTAIFVEIFDPYQQKAE